MKIKNYLIKILLILLKIFFTPFYIVSFLIPKNDKVWIFGSSSGKYYNDNSKYLFEFVSKIPGYKAIWLTKNEDVFKKLRGQGKNCFYFYSLGGIIYSLIARYVFISYSYDDVGHFCYLFPSKIKIIQLYHGTPLKRLGIERNRSTLNKIVKFIFILYLGRKFDFMFSSSDLSTQKLNEYFKVDKKRYITSGYPRNDALFERKEVPFLKKIKEKILFKKLIFYLPTYREYCIDEIDLNLFDKFGFNEKGLVDILEKYNAIFLIKLHPGDYAKAEYIIKKIDNIRIRIVNDEEIESDIYPLLSKTDILITDYSSVYFDFLLLDRPIIFSAFDKKEYEERDRGFYFNYNNITPGAKVVNWKELCNKLEETLQLDKYKKEREKINSLFNRFQDNKNRERVFNYFKNR
jgi:CDP-glycerol glycerophosphotransferase (TagB/SpsB family)